MSALLAAVDVGTQSARAGIVTAGGRLIARAEQPIDLHRRGPDIGEYSSDQIWRACCAAMREALALAGSDGSDVAGIGFDATCSLVVLDRHGRSLPVSPGPEGAVERDTIAWFDHRAVAEAREVGASRHELLDYSGGTVSPEMEVPKLMWLKRHAPDSWSRAGFMFDLADFLTWKATGSTARSQSTLTAKWAFLGHETPGWRRDFFERMGLGDVFARAALPDVAVPAGMAIGGMTATAAHELGLREGCPVAAGMIDAYAGALGVLGRFAGDKVNLHRHLGLIAGTSSAVMALSSEPRRMGGLWGPYFGAVLPGAWLNEGGQSATGALLDHLIGMHAAGGEADEAMHGRIVARILALRDTEGPDLAPRLHVLPDFHGNRSPIADPEALGVISGLNMDASFDGLCRLYFRASVGIALGLRQILETLNGHGYGIDTLHVTGGHARNPLLMELYRNATGCAVVTRNEGDAVMIGNGMTAATAAGLFPDLPSAGAAMCEEGSVARPDASQAGRFERDYRIFLAMQDDRRRLEALAAEPVQAGLRSIR